ncbi:MAG TPA: hypothetical protein P5330_09045 [Candidatus Competibacteraceae bacterium]|nr:hypothetical protein [Candidatus Competibacteraceae bacterium]
MWAPKIRAVARSPSPSPRNRSAVATFLIGVLKCHEFHLIYDDLPQVEIITSETALLWRGIGGKQCLTDFIQGFRSEILFVSAQEYLLPQLHAAIAFCFEAEGHDHLGHEKHLGTHAHSFLARALHG